MKAITQISSRTVVLPFSDIDTDQIIPARFLTTTTRDGLGKHLFSEWRYLANGDPDPGFVLNDPAYSDCHILVAGNNFGCGSSREHAPWALLDFGINAIISTELADIFCSNALKNGLLPVVVDRDTHQWLIDNPGAAVEIDIAESTLTLPDRRVTSYPIDAFARYCLLEGTDQLGYLQKHSELIGEFEERRTWTP